MYFINRVLLSLPAKALASFLLIICCTACVDTTDLEFTPVLEIEPSCFDGLKNGNETNIDCGGACNDFCGESLEAPCSQTLSANEIFSADDNQRLSIERVTPSRSYNYSASSILLQCSYEGYGSPLDIWLPVKKFPTGKARYELAEELVEEGENRRAVMKVRSPHGYLRVSGGGSIYLQVEDNNTFKLEFCDVIVRASNKENFRYSGSITFEVNDSSMLY